MVKVCQYVVNYFIDSLKTENKENLFPKLAQCDLVAYKMKCIF